MRSPSPAEEARRTADATGREFVHKLSRALPAWVDTAELDRLLNQLRADEYEAGYATGYAQHPGNRPGLQRLAQKVQAARGSRVTGLTTLADAGVQLANAVQQLPYARED